MDRQRKPKAQHLGTVVDHVWGKQPDQGFLQNTTVNVPIATPYRKCYVERVSFQLDVILTFTGAGSCQWQLFKKPTGAASSAFTDVGRIDNNSTLTPTARTTAALSFLSNGPLAPDSMRTVNEGEYLFAQVTTANNAITSQCAGFIVTVELLILDS